jgi:T4-like virus tail tube protein gp19
MGLVPRATPARFHLELDGTECGFLDSVEGGSVTSEVVTEAPGAEHYLKKHLGPAEPEPIVLTFGLGLAPSVYAWLADAWNGNQSLPDGRIVVADATLTVMHEIEFRRAAVASVTFPKLDGSSRDPGRLTVVLEPEETGIQKAGGQMKSPRATKTKQWLVSQFSVVVDGLDAKQVAQVDAFTVVTAGSPIDFPGLRVTLAESGADTWRDWHRDFVVQGMNDDGQERSGALVLFDPTLQEIGRVELAGLGIHRLALAKAEAGQEALARVVAELYCERMELAL